MQHKTREPSDVRKPERAGNISDISMQHDHILSVRVCFLCVQLCYIMLLLGGSKLDISVTLHFQTLNVTVVQL